LLALSAALSLLTLLFSAVASPAAGPPQVPAKLPQSSAQYGFVQKADNQVLLQTESTNVNAGTQITVVALGKTQSFCTAQFVKKLNLMDLGVAQLTRFKISPTDSGRGLNIYVIKLNRPLNNFTYGIAALAPSTCFMTDGAKVAMSLGTLPPAHFRSCASTQGTHFSVWIGKELTGARIWHYYMALGHDGGGNDKSVCRCQEGDY
jgi:hypothetical protein